MPPTIMVYLFLCIYQSRHPEGQVLKQWWIPMRFLPLCDPDSGGREEIDKQRSLPYYCVPVTNATGWRKKHSRGVLTVLGIPHNPRKVARIDSSYGSFQETAIVCTRNRNLQVNSNDFFFDSKSEDGGLRIHTPRAVVGKAPGLCSCRTETLSRVHT